MWWSLHSRSTTCELQTFSSHLTFDKCFKDLCVECEFMESLCSKTDFIWHKANTFSNNNKQVIFSNNTTGPRIIKNEVSVMQCIFSLLGAMKLVFTCLKAIKVAFAFEFALEQICRLKIAFDECNQPRHILTQQTLTLVSCRLAVIETW